MPADSDNTIQPQVTLPYSVALEVVLQGLRIRMGRSIVTMMGVVLGVAFLMSVFCSNAIRGGMAEESEIRNELSRMLRFLEADSGEIREQPLAIFVRGELSPIEQRFLQHLEKQGAGELRIFQPDATSPLPRLKRVRSFQTPTGIGENAAALILIGNGDHPYTDVETALVGLQQPVVASTHLKQLENLQKEITSLPLEQEIRPEEQERAEQKALQNKVRNIWIVAIALLVTIIGITNSLLMSVTERFKEIGTMKCLGALSYFIRRIFFIESALTGLVGSLFGGLLGFLIAAIIYAFTFGFGLVFVSINYGAILGYYLLSLLCGITMSILAAIYPASFASRMVPADALRTTI